MKLGIGAGTPSTLAKRLAGLTFLRLLVLGAFLAIVELYYNRELSFGGFSTQVAVTVIAVAFSLTAAYAIMLRRGESLERLAFVQLATDQLTWTAVAYISGGVTSGSTSLYGLTCLSGAILLGTRGAFMAAVAGMLSYLAMCAAFVQGWLLPPMDQAPDAYVVALAEMVYPAFSTLVATALVASLASYLSERLRTFGGQLEAATQRAERAERLAMLGRLSAALAHEIRNPLGAIRGSIELLRTGEGLADEDRRLCRIVEREVARLDDLVGDMVNLGRPRQPERQALDLAAAARSVVALANQDRDDSGIGVSYHGPSSFCVSADPSQMRQVLWNLVRNAMQASAEHGQVRIEIAGHADGGDLRVHDDGVGIPESQRDHIFDAFFTTRTHGVGIGLAVVKQICEAHDFSVQVDSGEECGTTVAVKLPKAALIVAGASLWMASLGCGGSAWLDSRASNQHEVSDDAWWGTSASVPPRASAIASPPGSASAADQPEKAGGDQPAMPVPATHAAATELFRNTYYDFPQEMGGAAAGGTQPIFDADCKPLGSVTRSFYEALCVQGSGRRADGRTVSFAKRDCPCAAVCPRTGQRICFELLDPTQFPHGRGATGKAITPLRTVAVDPKVIPLGTTLYIPAFQGLRGPDGHPHDGCFVAEDRGLAVRGKHVDIFTGDPATTRSWNASVPSNQGVRVMVGSSRCAHLSKPPEG